jgi:hypothetical protein
MTAGSPKENYFEGVADVEDDVSALFLAFFAFLDFLAALVEPFVSVVADEVVLPAALVSSARALKATRANAARAAAIVRIM